MKLIHFLTGGNLKVAAADLAKFHSECGGDENFVALMSLTGFHKAIKSGKITNTRKVESFYRAFETGEIANYTDIALMDIYLRAGKNENIDFLDFKNEFKGKMRMHLKNFKIPEELTIVNFVNLSEFE